MISITPDLFLKPLKEADQPQLFRLMEEIYPPAYEHLWEDGGRWYLNSQYQIETLSRELKEDGNHYFFVLHKNEIVGILRYLENTPLPEDATKNSVKLHRIYLHHKTQGKGVGKKLFEWVEQQAKNLSAPYIWLDVMDTQTQAVRFYEKSGYEQCGTRRLVLPGLHEHLQGMFYMKKKLNP